jgi:hypothetical protein
VISRATPSFWRTYDKLKQSDRDSARRVFRLFSANPAHNSLQFKKLRRHANVYSVRVTLDVRAVGYREGDIIEWFWIGTHNEFDKLFG